MDNIFNNVSNEIKNGLTPNQSIDFRELAIILLNKMGGTVELTIQELMSKYDNKYIEADQNPMTLAVKFTVSDIEQEQ